MIYIRKDILSVVTYSSITRVSISNNMEHIKEKIANFGAFKNKAKGIERICNIIQSSILLWKDNLETMMENNQWLC